MTMMPPEGTTGVKRSSQMKANPRGLFKQILDETPIADDPETRQAQVHKAFWDDVKAQIEQGELDMVAAIVEAWSANEFRNLTPRGRSGRRSDGDSPSDTTPSDEREAVAAQKVEAVAQEVAAIKASVKAIMLLDTVMPNGEALRECTREYLDGLSGDTAKMAARMKPGQKAGDVFTDDELRLLQQ